MDPQDASRADLIAYIGALEARVAEQGAQIVLLMARIKELEDRLVTDSHNSSQPPSRDPSRRRTRSLRQRSGKGPGGQPGHSGQSLQPVARPDRVVAHRPAACGRCGAALSGEGTPTGERRQVVDLPPLRVEVVEHQSAALVCPACGGTTVGAFPPGVSQPVQYGPRIQALAVYLREYQLLPSERTSELLGDVFGVAPAEATVQAAVGRCAAGLAQTEAAIKAAIGQSGVAHFDETGVYVRGRRDWLHTASTATLTFYARHRHRGKKATDAIGILPHYRGRAVHDGWSAYLAYAGCAHALCNAHHLRELTFLEEQDHQPWATRMKALLRAMNRQVATAKAAGQRALDGPTRQALVTRYEEILADGRDATPPAPPRRAGQRGRLKQSKARNLLERLRLHQGAILAFLDDFAVPFENSQAERDIRMAKVQQKISGCFRSDAGVTAFCRIRGYLSTLRKQGEPILPALQRVFTDTPVMPRLTPG